MQALCRSAVAHGDVLSTYVLLSDLKEEIEREQSSI
jgi:hypothetical protein